MPVTDPAYKGFLFLLRNLFLRAVNIDIIIATTVHLGKLHIHVLPF